MEILIKIKMHVTNRILFFFLHLPSVESDTLEGVFITDEVEDVIWSGNT